MAVLRTGLFAFALLCLNFRLLASQDGTCQNTCGGLPVMYPFGTGRGCGSPIFEQYINCTKGRLQLFTPRGQYYVQSIDYSNNIIVIQDPHMSTCSSMQYSSSFGLPVNAPFALADDTIVLLKCSSTSVYNSLSSLCDPAGTQICQGLYGCSSITQLGLPVDGPTSTCCVYSSTQLSTPPYEVDLTLLQCASYTSIYSFNGASNNFQNPNSWSYGIVLRYFYDQSAYSVSCKACQQTNGVCAFNVYGFVCVCSAGVNTTTRCYGVDVSHATARSLNLRQGFWSQGLINLGAVALSLLI